MGVRGFLSISTSLVATTLSLLLANAATAQFMAWPPGDRDQGIVNCATEHCLTYVSWASTGEYDLTANPTEAYFGQPEIQASIEKLKAALVKVIQEKAGDSPITQTILENQPELFLKQPAALFISSVNVEDKIFTGGAAMKLGDVEENANTLLNLLINNDPNIQFTTFEVEGAVCYSYEQPGEVTVQFGIVNNYFLLASGELKIVDLLANMKTPPPNWLKEIDQRMGIERPAFTVYANLNQLTKLFEEAMKDAKSMDKAKAEKLRSITDSLRLKEFESLQYQSGMNANGFNLVAHLNHAAPKEGLLSMFSAEAFENADITSIPEGVSFAVAMKFQPKNIFTILKQIATAADDGAEMQYNQAVREMKQRFGVDLEKDLIDALDGTMFAYTDRSLTSPKIVGAIRVKDPASFSKFYDALNLQLKKKLAQSGIGFQKTEKNDQTFFQVNLRNGMPICYGLVDDTLYFCNSVRGIISHLRKKDRDSGKLAQTPRFLEFIDFGKDKGFEGIVGFSEYDLSMLIETGLPMAKLLLQDKMDRDVFDFTLDDLPSVEVLLNGLRPTTNVIYRTKTGLAMRALNDLPIGFDISSSGVLIGMLLPAVQQVRNAARRTQSLNNLRQLALALLNYESAHGHFPPAYSVDEDGKPLLSWRVAILPHLEEKQLYDQFRLDEPWDSPHNIKLAEQMPALYSNPEVSIENSRTVYVAPVGQDSILSAGPINNAGAGNSYSDVSDGASNTQLLIVADEKEAVVWTSPNDLRYEELSDDRLVDAATGQSDTMVTVLCDGSTHSFDKEDVKAMGAKQIRGGFNKSDGVSLDFAP